MSEREITDAMVAQVIVQFRGDGACFYPHRGTEYERKCEWNDAKRYIMLAIAASGLEDEIATLRTRLATLEAENGALRSERASLVPLAKLGLWCKDRVDKHYPGEPIDINAFEDEALRCDVAIYSDTSATVAARALLSGTLQSEGKVGARPLYEGWAVVCDDADGYVIYDNCIGSSREEAIRRYDHEMGTQLFTQEEPLGFARCIPVYIIAAEAHDPSATAKEEG